MEIKYCECDKPDIEDRVCLNCEKEIDFPDMADFVRDQWEDQKIDEAIERGELK